jgi:predicted nucleic acid-binding protein
MKETNNSRVCLDANFLVKLAVDEEQSDVARGLWGRWVDDDMQACAPGLIWYEVTSTLRKRLHRATMNVTETRHALDTLLDLPVLIFETPDLNRAALAIATDLGQPVAYDAYYLAVAEELDCPLWTADERFYNAAKALFPRVHLLTSA